jgi:hypothetical protein
MAIVCQMFDFAGIEIGFCVLSEMLWLCFVAASRQLELSCDVCAWRTRCTLMSPEV